MTSICAGGNLTNRLGADDVRRGLKFLNQAVQADPKFALAHAAIAEGNLFLADLHQPALEVLPGAQAAAQRAIELSPTLADAHLAAAMVQVQADLDWPGATIEHVGHHVAPLFFALAKLGEVSGGMARSATPRHQHLVSAFGGNLACSYGLLVGRRQKSHHGRGTGVPMPRLQTATGSWDRAFTRSSATSRIMSSWPPTMRRLPSSTRMSRVSMPYLLAAASACRKKLE